MKTFEAGDRVTWKGAPAIVAYKRMKPPEYSEVAAYSLRIEGRGDTIVPAGEVSEPTTHIGRRQGQLADLEAFAASVGLDWVIAWIDRWREPYAYRLVSDAGKNVWPPQVIGETEEQARACITLAASQRKKGTR